MQCVRRTCDAWPRICVSLTPWIGRGATTTARWQYRGTAAGEAFAPDRSPEWRMEVRDALTVHQMIRVDGCPFARSAQVTRVAPLAAVVAGPVLLLQHRRPSLVPPTRVPFRMLLRCRKAGIFGTATPGKPPPGTGAACGAGSSLPGQAVAPTRCPLRRSRHAACRREVDMPNGCRDAPAKLRPREALVAGGHLNHVSASDE